MATQRLLGSKVNPVVEPRVDLTHSDSSAVVDMRLGSEPVMPVAGCQFGLDQSLVRECDALRNPNKIWVACW